MICSSMSWRYHRQQNRLRSLTSPSVRTRSSKMYVPSDSFGGLSPERKASQALQSLLTFVSAKIILAQLEGSGRGALAAYNQQQYQTLVSHLQEANLSDSNKWLESLMQKDKAVALRVMEVRDAYASTDFEWDQLQRLSIKAIKDSNLQLMRKAATASLLLGTETLPQAATAGAAASTPAEAAAAAQEVATAAPEETTAAEAKGVAEEVPEAAEDVSDQVASAAEAAAKVEQLSQGDQGPQQQHQEEGSALRNPGPDQQQPPQQPQQQQQQQQQ